MQKHIATELRKSENVTKIENVTLTKKRVVLCSSIEELCRWDHKTQP